MGRGSDVGPIQIWVDDREARASGMVARLAVAPGVAVGFGIPVLRSADEAESASLNLYTARQLQAPAKAPIRRTGRRTRGKRALQVFLLTGLPGVGAARAKGLMDKFGSVEAVVCASERALTEVEGIGKRTAQRIHWAVHEVGEPYLS